TESRLCQMSPSTIDRLLRPCRQVGGRRGLTTTKPGSLLKSSIPIRTFADWQENKSGFLEVDLVAHCGDNVGGFYLNTLCAVDVASGWTECLAVWGKGQERVKAAVHRMRMCLPFPLLGVDSDNGSEFINQCFYSYCHQEKITFTRSRAYKKNDSCHVEQKNGNVVRRLVGYDRYTSRVAYQCLERLYNSVRLYINFFQPTMKLLDKTRNGAKVHKVYDMARTPYQRLMESDVINEIKKTQLAATYHGLNPVRLLKQINSNLEQLWGMAERLPTR
ncbi:transposase family protein, partial [Chloroflexota bacterium]